MSDTMTSGEIDDVLTSIRRLVSEEARPERARMSENLAANVPARKGEVSKGPARTPTRVRATPDQAGISADGTHISRDRIIAAPPLILTPDLRVDERAADAAVSPALVLRDPVTPAFSLDRLVNSIGAAVENTLQDWEAEAGEAPAAMLPRRTASRPDDAPFAQDDDAGVLAPETPDKTGGLQFRHGKGALRDARRRPDEMPTATESPLIGTVGDDESYLDEATLRDMVRDIIREELRGQIGERITRNVRKLVQAEIARALTARDFD